jgi:[ribosomal protein S5]-alanine N-acetyltransferase
MEIILQTERLYLRKFTMDDVSILFELNSSDDVVKYTGNPAMKDAAEALQVLTEIILPQYELGLGRWAVHRRADDAFVGWCGLKQIQGHVDLGYRFKKNTWGHGYATESAKAVLDYGFNVLHLPKIIAHVHLQNKASAKVLEKIGMKPIGIAIADEQEVYGFTLTAIEFQYAAN